MATRSIQPHNERPQAVWSSGGASYDDISRQIASALEHCVVRVDPRPGERMLDHATGTGWTSRLLAARGAQVVGVDLAPDLVATARTIAQTRGWPIEYEVGDAESLRFEDASFDAVVSTVGVMFVTRPEAAAAEIARIVRPGGRIGLVTWKPDGSVFEMFKVMKPYMPPPPATAPPSPFEWGKRERIQALFGDAFELGFEDGETVYRERDGEAAWRAFATGYGPTRTLAQSLDDERREALHRDFVAFHDRRRTELGVTLPREYLVTVGRRR
jgi:SAM-dependent methyltransferase